MVLNILTDRTCDISVYCCYRGLANIGVGIMLQSKRPLAAVFLRVTSACAHIKTESHSLANERNLLMCQCFPDIMCVCVCPQTTDL